MRVVNDLHVVWLGTAIKEQPNECVTLRMRRAIFLAFPDHPYERRVPAVARHEVRIRICTCSEGGPRDCDGIVDCRGERKSREAEVKEWLPSFGSDSSEQVPRAARPRSIWRSEGIFFDSSSGRFGKYPLDLLQITADDGSVNAVARDFRMPLENSHCGVPRHDVC